MPFGTCSEEVIDREVVNRSKKGDNPTKNRNQRRENCLTNAGGKV